MSFITAPHLRSRTTQDDILLAIADRLREHDLLNTQTVVVSDQAVPEDMPGGGFCIVVAPGDGRFPAELWDAGSHAQACEDGSVIVAIYTKIRRDRRGRKEFSLFGRRSQLASTADETRRPSLVTWKREVLKLLVVGQATLADDSNAPIETMRQTWEPSRDGVPLLRDGGLKPVNATKPLDVPDFPGWIGLQITFSIAWDWDLYA